MTADIRIVVKMTRDGFTDGPPKYIAYLISSELGENLGSFDGKSLSAVIDKAAQAGKSYVGSDVFVEVSLQINEMHDDPAPEEYAYCNTYIHDWTYDRAERVADHLIKTAL